MGGGGTPFCCPAETLYCDHDDDRLFPKWIGGERKKKTSTEVAGIMGGLLQTGRTTGTNSRIERKKMT
jgi:hypothetical protein